MEALVTDVEVAVDFILPAIHKAIEQEVRHRFIGSATEIKRSDTGIYAVNRYIRSLFVSIRPQLELHLLDNFHREMAHPTAIGVVAHDHIPASETFPR